MTAKLYFFNRKKQQTSLIYCLKTWTKYWLAVLIQSSSFKHSIDRNHSGKSNEWERKKARNMKLSCTIILSNSTKRFNGQKGQQTFKSENCVFRLVTYNQLQNCCTFLILSPQWRRSSKHHLESCTTLQPHLGIKWKKRETVSCSQKAKIICWNTNHQQQ